MQKTDTSEGGHQRMLTMQVLAFFWGGGFLICQSDSRSQKYHIATKTNYQSH